MYGQELYTDKGVYVGRLEDVSIDIRERRISGLVVRNVNPSLFNIGKKRGVIIPYRWVTAVGDIILIKHVRRRGGRSAAEIEEGKAEMKGATGVTDERV